jgi:hypothetical protein
MTENDNKISFIETELIKVSLGVGDVLAVKVISDTVTKDSLESLNKKLTQVFPNNKIMVFCVPPGENIEFAAIQNPSEMGCGPQTCADCNCGKGERK